MKAEETNYSHKFTPVSPGDTSELVELLNRKLTAVEVVNDANALIGNLPFAKKDAVICFSEDQRKVIEPLMIDGKFGGVTVLFDDLIGNSLIYLTHKDSLPES